MLLKNQGNIEKKRAFFSNLRVHHEKRLLNGNTHLRKRSIFIDLRKWQSMLLFFILRVLLAILK